MKTKYLAGLSIAASLALTTVGVSFAQQDPIAQRKALMKEVGAATKLASDMNKGEKPYDAKAAAAAMQKIADGWAPFAKLFPPGSDKGDTTAAPAIWTNTADFNAKGEAMAKAAAVAVKEAEKGHDAFKAAFGAVATCKGCHDAYRVKK